jgi:hypothetical protein
MLEWRALMDKSPLAKIRDALPSETQREIAAHEAKLSAILRMTERATREHDRTADQITRQAIVELEGISGNISASNLPPEEKQRLRERVSAAFAVHNQLLDQAAQAAKQAIHDVAQTPVKPKRSAFGSLLDEIDDTLDDLDSRLFKR